MNTDKVHAKRVVKRASDESVSSRVTPCARTTVRKTNNNRVGEPAANDIDAQAVSQYGLIERYVAGTLSSEVAESFEDYFLDKPELVAEVRFERALRQELVSQAELLETKTMRSNTQGHWQIAAALLAAVLVVGSAVSISKIGSLERLAELMQAEINQVSAPKVVVATFALNKTRSGHSLSSIPRPSPGQLHAISVTATNGSEYALRILNSSNEPVWSTASVNPMGTGRVSFLIGHDTLLPGSYTLLVNRVVRESDLTDEYSLRFQIL